MWGQHTLDPAAMDFCLLELFHVSRMSCLVVVSFVPRAMSIER